MSISRAKPETTADATSGDIFLAQLSPAGVTNWTKTLASTAAAKERAYGVAVNGANVYVAGFTNGVLAGAPAGTTNQGGSGHLRGPVRHGRRKYCAGMGPAARYGSH